MTKKEIETIRKTAYKKYDAVGPSAVYDYALTLKGIEYSYCIGCEAETPTLKDEQGLSECLVCGSAKPKDIYFKDEGDMLTVCFQTPKAIEAISNQPKEVQDALYGSDNYKKLDVELDQKSLLVAWSMSENLTWDSELPITINNDWCKCKNNNVYNLDDDLHWRCSKCKKLTQID